MIVTLVQIDAQDASGGAVTVRLASHDRPECCHLGGFEWEPALSALPDFALDFFGGEFAGQVTAPRTGFAAATTGLPGFGSVAASRARFADARVRIWHGEDTSTATVDLGPLTLRFDGRITGEPQIDNAARIATFEAAVKDSWADKPLLALFAGTGGIEGPADLTGQVKPLVLGNARFCGGVLIDSVNNIWMVSNGPIQSVNAVYDRLASLGSSTGDYANLAALIAASIPNGSWGTCLAQGLVRLAAPPDGRVSFHVSGSNSGTGGYVRLPGAIIRRIAELAGGTVNAASLTALDSARPYNLQLQLREQVTPRAIIGQIADSVAAVAGVSLTGQLFAQALAIGSPSDTLNADDTSDQRVAAVEEQAKAAPRWRLATEAELTFEVHSADEAAFEYRWQGTYSASRVYRLDDVVAGPDSAAWVWIASTPAAGQALPVWPVTSNAYWQLFQAPGGAGITISGGVINGIGTGNGTPVDNTRNLLTGTLSSLPAGEFIGQQTTTSDTGQLVRWSGSAWVATSDITATVTGVSEIVLSYNSAGVLQTALPVVETFSLIPRGGSAYASGVTWAVSVLSGTFASAPTISGSGSGQLSINGDMTSPEALLRITPTIAGQAFPPFTVKVVKSVAVATANPSITDTLVGPSTSSFTTVGEVTITLGSTTTAVNLTAASLALRTANTNLPVGESTVEMKWTRETTFGGGTFADVGALATSSPNPGVVADAEGIRSRQVGSITCNRSATGLTAGSQQRFRLVARISAGNIRTINATGTASVTP